MVMKVSRDCGAQGWSPHQPDEAMVWPQVPTVDKPPWTIGWGNLSRRNSFFNDRVHNQNGVTNRNMKVRESLCEEDTQLRMNDKKSRRQGIPGRENSKCKGPGAEKTFKYLRSKNECSMPGECWSSLP